MDIDKIVVQNEIREEMAKRIEAINSTTNFLGQLEYNKFHIMNSITEEMKKEEYIIQIGTLEENKYAVYHQLVDMKRDIEKFFVEKLKELGIKEEEVRNFTINMKTGEVSKKK